MTPATLGFRFDADAHEYTALDTGEVLPHITGLLEQAGLIDRTWFTEESSERGRVVHRLTAAYDLGAEEVGPSKYRGWLLAHFAAMRAIKPVWTHVEIPLVDPVHRFGGRPDRVGWAFRLKTVLEVKTGVPQPKADPIQLALQAILAASEGGLPAEHYQRLSLYEKQTGRYKLEQHKDRRDFDVAREILRTYAA